MSEDKFQGKVKFFSMRKAWGYVTPTSDNAPTKEDIFFHQTSINSEQKSKWLAPGYEVQFTVYLDDEGRYKCKTVSAADGSPCVIPKRIRKRGKGSKKEDGDAAGDGAETPTGDAITSTDKKEPDGSAPKNGKAGNKKGKGDKKKTADKPKAAGARQPRKRFDNGFSDELKEKLKEKKYDLRQNSLLVVLDNSRIKFGPDGYAALAGADGVLAEGKFVCDEEGKVTFTWNKMLKYESDDWKLQDEAACGALVKSLDFFDDNVHGLKQVETPESLWGEGKKDETKALETHKFEMKKCFLVRSTDKKKGRRNRPASRNNKNKKGAGEKKDAAKNGKSGENNKENAANGKKKDTKAVANGKKEAEQT